MSFDTVLSRWSVAFEERRLASLDAATTQEASLREAEGCRSVAERMMRYTSHPPSSRGTHADAIDALISEPQVFDDRFEALSEALDAHLDKDGQAIVFCSDAKTADRIAQRLRAGTAWRVFRHQADGPAWKPFLGEDGAILVCDAQAEEGLNLQGGERLAVHYDLPLNPNRLEQRLGRLDRYGSGAAVRSVVLACADNPIEIAWSKYLNDALQVFDRSIASLQYLLDGMGQRLTGDLWREGPEAIINLTARGVGVEGEVETELRAIDRQDELDGLNAPAPEALEALVDIDENWRLIEAGFAPWLEGMLHFRRDVAGEREGDQGAAFRYEYVTGPRHTLLPLEAVHDYCKGALDLSERAALDRKVRTFACSYRRRAVLSRQGRAVGARLMRVGDPFVDGIAAFTASDDRGRSMAMWRYLPARLCAERRANVFVRFDFVVGCDLDDVRNVLQKAGRHTKAAEAAMSRRGDMAVPPGLYTIWIDRDLRVVSDTATLRYLNAPYSGEARDKGGRDFNLNAERWRALDRLALPEIESWGEFCARARLEAEARLRELPELSEDLARAAERTHALDVGRLGQLHARATKSEASARERDEYNFERALSVALIEGIKRPAARVEAVSAVFLSDDASVASALART